MLHSSLLIMVVISTAWNGVISGCEAFQIAPISTFRRQLAPATGQRSHTTSVFAAGKRKRRRKVDSSDGPDDISDVTEASDELPDFDLTSNDKPAASTKASNPPKPTKSSSADMNEISPEMMARSSSKPARSVKQLIRDRSLESKFVFDDDDVDESIPDLAVVAASSKQRKDSRQSSSKKSSQNTPPVEETPNFLERIPFFRDEYTGKFTPLKVLEAGTWLGIFLLLSWEVYINSPFFDRAAPLVPVVY